MQRLCGPRRLVTVSVSAGLTREEARKRFWVLASNGLLGHDAPPREPVRCLLAGQWAHTASVVALLSL